jgi:hypothetical protein
MGRQKPKVAADDATPAPREKKYTFADIRRAIFKTPPKPHTLEELKEGIEKYMREKHARR